MTDTDHETTGYRFISRDFSAEPQIGDSLENSFVWDGDEITEDELRGTCCFETRAQVEAYAKYSKGNGWIVMVGGDSAGRGDDFVGEILIAHAEVLEVSPW
jgi:dissimilatory sulfite reductase (desulfoviridin) alpha/beta subunit